MSRVLDFQLHCGTATKISAFCISVPDDLAVPAFPRFPAFTGPINMILRGLNLKRYGGAQNRGAIQFPNIAGQI